MVKLINTYMCVSMFVCRPMYASEFVCKRVFVYNAYLCVCDHLCIKSVCVRL